MMSYQPILNLFLIHIVQSPLCVLLPYDRIVRSTQLKQAFDCIPYASCSYTDRDQETYAQYLPMELSSHRFDIWTMKHWAEVLDRSN